MQRISFSSLRVRFFLLVLFAVIPALGAILYTAAEQRRSSIDREEKNLALLATIVSKEYDSILTGARDLLVGLKGIDEIVSSINSRCNAIFANLEKQFDKYIELAIATPEGEIICGSRLPIASIKVTDRSWFRRALTTRQFAVGDHEINEITNQPAITFAQPVLTPSGNVKSILFATMTAKWLQDYASAMELPAMATLTLIDRNFTALVHSPKSDRPLAELIPKDFFFDSILTMGSGVAQATRSDGTTHLFGFTQVSAASQGNIYLIISQPKDLAFAEANRLLQRNLAVLGLLALVVLAAAWMGGEFVFLRRMNALLTATKQIGAANFSIRSKLLHSKDELGQLARAFDEMAEQLEKSAQLKADFASMIVHDLRSPLNAIVGIAAMIEDGVIGPITEEQKKWLGKIAVNCNELLLLINNYLDLSKIEAGHIDLVKEPVDLHRLIENSIDNYIALAKNKNVSLRSHFDPALPSITADQRCLDRVLSNLISNAIKFTPEGGAIEIGAAQENHADVKLWVKDDGAGIASGEISTLFQKYGQTSSGKTSAQKGTGLGLVIVKTIVESHDGRVDVESVAGKGATFTVRLPVGA